MEVTDIRAAAAVLAFPALLRCSRLSSCLQADDAGAAAREGGDESDGVLEVVEA